MKKFNIENCNSSSYWDTHQTALDFGLRQQKYLDLAGVGNTILEVGCGLSPFLEVARKNFSNTIGFDFSPETIKKAQELFPKVDYRLFDVTKLNEIENKFANVVVAGEVIEHLEDPDNFLKELERLAITKVIISTPVLEFEDPEHLWQFSEEDFISRGYKVEVIKSERFVGRSYIFAVKHK